MIFETIEVGPMQVNCYVLACAEGGKAMIIDPGDQYHKINLVLKKYKLKPVMVINTHGHYDHIGSDDEFGVTVYVHKLDLPMLQNAGKNLSANYAPAPYAVKSEIKTLADQEIIKLDCFELEVLHLPGHTRGGIGLLMKKPQTDIIFTGDTLFNRGIGRYDLDGGSRTQLEQAIKQKLFTLPADTIVYPGHGPTTTIGEEKDHNLFGD
ncbi:MAG: MBL fold metallo-hydrolase [Candidatus Omnitrophica bacterium CG11_big_fil_rev_8_21_14_0_20_41_12]|nr:MAG: MBL fold metallo-hydrolase [Candidatus Omnitrophica bacterium CG11_big_fil_rev_8_21_14_0_20_41_12]